MRRLLWLFLLVLAAGAASAQTPAPRTLTTVPVTVSPKGGQETRSIRRGDYVIGAGDVVEIAVFDHQELSGKFPVAGDGSISFPLVGTVRLAGRSVEAAESAVRDALAEGFLRQPQVTLTVSEYGSRRVFLIGEVRTPGVVPMASGLTLLEVLAKAGSVTESAGVELSVIRPEAGARVEGPLMPGQLGASKAITVSLTDLQRGAPGTNIALQDGDTVFVPKGAEIYVLGQVKTPGPQPFRQSLTVFQAISIAGGTTELGATSRVRIVRIVGNDKKELKGKLTDLVLPGDTIMVPTRWF